MRLAITLITLLVTCLPALCTEVSKTSSELDKPVTLAVKGESLADVAGMMEKQTSAKLRVSRDIQEQKVTVFVDKMPLRNVIDGICTVFRFRFSRIPDSKTYEIWEPGKDRQARVNTTVQAEAEAWKRVETNIDSGIAYSSMNPEARAKTRAGIPSDTQDPRLRELAELYKSIDDQPLTSVLIRLLDEDSRVLGALRSGLSVHFDSRSTESEWGVPQSVLDGLPALAKLYPDGGLSEVLSSHPKANEDRGSFMHLGISCDLNPNTRSAAVQSSLEYSRGSGYPYGMMMCNVVSVRLADRATASVQVKLPRVGSPEFLDRKVSLTAEELAKEAALPGTANPGDGIYVNRSDVLALLHKHLGIQVISDHYSFWHRMDPVYGQPVAGVLNGFSHESVGTGTGKPSQEAVRGWDEQSLYMRIEQAALADAAEIPNQPLRHWREVFRRQGCLGLDELAEIVLLNDHQIRGLRSAARFHGIDAMPLYQFDTANDSSGYVADGVGPLRLYGLLTTAQRQQALTVGTHVDRFTKDQYMALADMLRKVVKPGNGFKAGLYNGELRVDKQVTDSQMQPNMMRISGSSGSGYQYQPPNAAAEPVAAETPERAWQQVLAKHPGANKKDLKLIPSSCAYEFTVYLADGSSHVWTVSVGQRTAEYSDWQRGQK